MKSPILGSSYVARSVNAADNRMVNLFPEIVPEGGKDPAFLQRCPGLTLFKTIAGNKPIRGMWSLYNVVYVVCGSSLYKMDVPNYTPTLISGVSVITGGNSAPVSIADNGTQIMIVTNDGNGYIYDTSSTVFTPMVVGVYANYPGGTTVAFLDGYFVINKPNSQRVYVSALYDGTTWDATDFASAEGSSDYVVGIIVSHGELWVFGTNTTEVWYNAGTAGFPFAPIQGAFSETGCTSRYTIAKIDNSIYWLGSDSHGGSIIYKAVGYKGERASTHAVEWQIQQKDLTGASAYTYQQDGHSFYVLNTGASATIDATTWVYDTVTQSWHERQSYDSGTASYARHWGNSQCVLIYTSGVLLTLIGDYESTGNIYYFDSTAYADNSTSPQKWIRSWRALPMGQNNLKRTAQHSLQLDCETGTAPDNWVVTLRWSDDGGHTWSNNHTVTVTYNSYSQRIIWRRLGMTQKLRDRVYEVSSSDPAKIAIMGAELVLSPTNA